MGQPRLQPEIIFVDSVTELNTGVVVVDITAGVPSVVSSGVDAGNGVIAELVPYAYIYVFVLLAASIEGVLIKTQPAFGVCEYNSVSIVPLVVLA